MALQSMTGFARADGGDDRATWHWEVRTVNGKGLDIRVRLPSGFDELEPHVRKTCGRFLRRGNCTVNLAVQSEAGGYGVRLNEAMLVDLAKAAERAGEITGLEPPGLEGLLSMRGVMEVIEAEEDEASQRARQDAMSRDLARALGDLQAARVEEGARLAVVLETLIARFADLVAEISEAPGRDLAVIRDRLQSKLDRLLADDETLDPSRLHQEVTLLATKADIEEEIERLKSHVAAARKLLGSDEPVGRQLDFLSQEFNREANTICSKANDEEITRLGLELKTLIDQFREQVQNIE